MTHEQNQNNVLLGILAFCFKIAGLLTISQFLSLLFSVLSVVSVLMMIVINWDKFIARIKKIKIKGRKRK